MLLFKKVIFAVTSSLALYYEPRVAVVLKHCQGCMRVHVCVGFVMGRLSAYFLHIA